jgi:hypothetical protein
MPIARFEMPDGRIGRFEVPEGTTPEQAQALISESMAQQPAPPSGNRFDLRGEGYERLKNYNPTDTVGGIVRGAGSIGATLLAPVDAALSAAGMDNVPYVGSQDRRGQLDPALRNMGVDTESTPFQTSKLATEVAGTLGVGGTVANLLGRIPGATTQIPALLNTIRTGGMTTGAPAGASRVADMATRVAGGAVSGGATAGAVDPEYASTGALFGGAFPVAAKVVGGAADAVGSMFRAPPVNATKLQTAKDAIEAGYVIPPSQIKPTLTNRILESTSGKQATEQIVSTKNTAVTEGLVRKALGIADDVPLTQSTLESLRKTAGKTYAEVSSLSPQAAADLEALKVARNEAQGWFKAYNRSARPDDLAKAKQARALSDSLELALEGHAKAAGRDSLTPALRDARKEIAKTYTVGRALNDAAGTVDARVLGRMHEKGLPLSDGLDVAGKFASAFPKAAKSPQQIGSPAVHNLTSMFSTGGGAAGAAGGALLGGGVGAGVGAALGLAYPYVVPPAARSIMFSKGAQRGLLTQGGSQGLLGASLDEALPLLYRSTPLLAGRSGQ